MSLILSGTDGLSDVDGSAATPAIRGTDANTGIFFPAADTIAFAEGGAEVARFDSSGNLGIGTTSPNARITVKAAGNSYTNGALALVGSVSGTSYITGIGSSLYFSNNGSTDHMVLDSSGNLLVGATSTRASAKLDVRGETIALGANASFYGTIGYNGGTGLLSLAAESAGGINFLAGTTERARFDTSGNLLVGTASKLTGGVDGLDINTAAESGITFAKSGTVKNYFYLNSDALSFRWQTVSGVTADVVSNTNGVTLTNGATSWATLSDERKKDIIEPIIDAATKVSSLRAVIGKYKTEEDGIRRAMLIAQDVQAVLPEAVVENKDGELLLQYTEIIPLLVAAIKEQSALITQLTARITALESA